MTPPTPAAPPKSENLLINLACNIAAPTFILTKGVKLLGMEPKAALLLALSFPLGYGIYDLVQRRKFNALSVLGFCSTLATGGLSLLKLQPFWFAVKEAMVPTIIGLTIIISQWTKHSLIRSLLFSDLVIDVPRVEAALAERNQQAAFARLLNASGRLFASSFALSAVLNFVLARLIITAQPDTSLFNEQLGRLTWISYIVIMIPSLAIMLLAIWRLVKGLEKLSGLTLDEILKAPPEKKVEAAKESTPPAGSDGGPVS